MPTDKVWFLGSLVLVAATVVCTGCGPKAPVAPAKSPAAGEKTPSEPKKATEAPKQVAVTDAMKAILDKADKVDGTADKVVTKCAVCELGMDGSKEHALQVGEYTLLFCSDDCKQTFAKDIEKSVLSIHLPK